MNMADIDFSPSAVLWLHGVELEGVTFHRGSTSAFVVWTNGIDWGHAEPNRVTRFNRATRTHDVLPSRVRWVLA